MLDIQDLINYLYMLIEYFGYYNSIIIIIILYISYYLISKTFMFLIFIFFGIIIGMYISNYLKKYM
jgi:hypothetical protein